MPPVAPKPTNAAQLEFSAQPQDTISKAGLTEAIQSKVVLYSLSAPFPRLKMFLKFILIEG